MAVTVLSPAERDKLDRSDDTLFYAEPRFVHHLDASFRARLTQLLIRSSTTAQAGIRSR
jgi:hypothetical protein